ncbi:Hypothetical predicted protein [Mytilus galloprovincialis]|uniref:C2H2-type domain-containing protein n=1 Tax=Mytilus galloprovincialis TaxID=29158 RepID=A0A8B6DMW3_MYTGA|nr:Hypothetical predicted protein [Mytilus galloprovincialis]
MSKDKESSFKDDLRDIWPSEGMCCEVVGCTGPILKTHAKYTAHWKLKHVTQINIFSCPHKCKQKYAEKCKMNRHLKLMHKYNTDMVSAIEIPVSKEENMHYVCPGNVLYRKVSKVNTEASDAAMKARQDYIREQNLPVRVQPSGDLQVCRGHYVDFNNNLTEA